MFSTKLSSNKNFSAGYNGTVGSDFDDFGLLGMAATGTVWLAIFAFSLLSTGCTPTAGTSAADHSPVVEASTSSELAVPVTSSTTEAPETTSGNVVDMTY